MSGEHGGVTGFVTVMVVPIVAMAGLAFDGGVLLAERRAAYDAARNAALAATQAVDPASARRGEPVLDGRAAAQAAVASLDRAGYEGAITTAPYTEPTEVEVTVSRRVDFRLLSIVGLSSTTVSATATSRLAVGVESGEP